MLIFKLKSWNESFLSNSLYSFNRGSWCIVVTAGSITIKAAQDCAGMVVEEQVNGPSPLCNAHLVCVCNDALYRYAKAKAKHKMNDKWGE